jgi:hypothetical protein
VNVVAGDGSSRLAAVIQGAISRQAGRQRAQIEFASLVGEPTTPDLQPDSWTGMPWAWSTYYVVEPFLTGLLRTNPSGVPPSDVGDHGSHAHGEHEHTLVDAIQPLRAGDRVLIVWVGPSPCVLGRLK